MEHGTGNDLGISYLHDYVLYRSDDEDVMLGVEAENYYIKSPTKSTAFHVTSFYKAAKMGLTELHDVHEKQETDALPPFQSFIAVKLQGMQGSWRSVTVPFSTTSNYFTTTRETKRSSGPKQLRCDKTAC